MAGHSKFKNIMHRKGAQDKKRAKVFAKLIRELTVASREGGPDPAANPRLRTAIATAKASNLPKDTMQAAIDRGAGNVDGESYTEMRYEAYGPGGVALMIEALTDNRNRTAGDVRSTLTKHGGNLGETNSVSFMFNRLGQITYPATVASVDEMLEAAIEAGAQNVESDDDSHVITCAVEDFGAVTETLNQKLGDAQSAELVWQPLTTTQVDIDTAKTLFKMIDALEDNDDVQSVFANYDVSDEVMEQLASN